MATQNTGQQSYFILEQVFLNDLSETGLRKPNLASNSPQATVPNTATITYKYPTDVTPSGGANGDIWYNPVADQLFKKISGTWTLLTDRVADSDYIAPIENTSSCPLPNPPPVPKHFLLIAGYGLTIQSVTNGNTTGIPSAFAGPTLGLTNTSLSAAYTSITAGNIAVVLSGTPVSVGHVRLFLQVNGVEVQQITCDNRNNYTLVLPSDVANPTSIIIGIETF